MRPVPLILRYRARAFRRWTAAHGFEIFALGPVIVGGALWVLDRQLAHLRRPLGSWLEGGGAWPGATSLGLALLLVAVGAPSTFRALYGPRRAGRIFDPLPVPETARFNASLAVELARALPAFAVLWLAAGALAGEWLGPTGELAARTLRLLAATLTLALARFAAVLWSAHRPGRGPSTNRFRVAGRGLLAASAAALALWAPHPALKLLLLPLLAPAAQLEAAFLDALGKSSPEMPWATAGVLAATALVLYLLGRLAYLAWHRHDLETAGRPAAGRRWPFRLTRLLSKGFPDRPLAVQVGRDLLLVLRRFSPAVTLSAALVVVLDAAVLSLLADPALPVLWRQRLAVCGLTLSVLAVAALVPFLLAHELPRFWIEKSTGVGLERIWKAKLWTAALLAAAPYAAGVAVLLAAPGLEAAARWTAVAQISATAWIVTSILGLAVFEIADQPLLGLVFGSLLGLALASLFVFYPQAWWLWAVGYLWVAGQIAGRASRRVRLVEARA